MRAHRAVAPRRARSVDMHSTRLHCARRGRQGVCVCVCVCVCDWVWWGGEQCMAHPSGVAVSADGKVVYVAETMANRIVRFVKQKHGVFLSSELPLFRV